MQTITRILTQDINGQKLARDIRLNSGGKFLGVSFSGYKVDPTKFTTGSTVPNRIYIPRLAGDPALITRISNDVPDPAFVFQPGEIRFYFDPALTTAQETAFDNLVTAHDPLLTTPKQVEEDVDEDTITSLENFYAGVGTWTDLTVNQQNGLIDGVVRMILRMNDKVQGIE